MRFIIFVLAFTLSVIPATAQKKGTGEEYFKNKEYALAVKAFEKELKKAKKKKSEQAKIEAYLGMSYYYMNKPADASKWLKNSIDKGYKKADAYCIYGLSLQKQENYTEALEAFNQCLKTDSKYPNADLYIESCNYAIAHPEPNEYIALHSSKVNTDGSEYGISPCADGEIFFSRASSKGRIDPRTGLTYTEVFVSKMDGEDLSKPKKEKTFMKAYYNTGIFSYDAHAKTLYMTICDPKGKCGIYKSLYNRNNWAKPEPFLISDEYDMVHPAISPDGNRLYFSSNAPNGYGKTDIWYIDRVDGDQWGNPVNMGSGINTPGREEFPFVDGDTLYFASDGHVGFGGLDIFKATVRGNEVNSTHNLGRPFNSGADDFNLTTTDNKGLLVSSRNISNSDDIYIFAKSDLNKTTPTKKEEKSEPEIETKPEVKPETITESTPKPVVVTEKPKPETVPTTPVQPKTDGFVVIYFDFNRFVPQREYRHYDKIVSQMKAYPNATFEIAGYADPRGGTEFNAELSDKRAEYVAKRLIDRGIPKSKLIIKGYGFNDPAVPNATTEAEFQKNRRVEIRIIKTSN